MRIGVALSLLVASSAALVADPAVQRPTPLASARQLTCTFTFFVATRWVDGVPEARADSDEFTFGIDAIDLGAHTARIIGATASADASVFLTDTGLNVIEQTPIGNFIVTTVFSSGQVGDDLLAVHSRHLGDVIAPPSPSQYLGSCRVVR